MLCPTCWTVPTRPSRAGRLGRLWERLVDLYTFDDPHGWILENRKLSGKGLTSTATCG